MINKKVELSQEEIALIIAAMALSRKNFEDETLEELEQLIIKFKELRN